MYQLICEWLDGDRGVTSLGFAVKENAQADLRWQADIVKSDYLDDYSCADLEQMEQEGDFIDEPDVFYLADVARFTVEPLTVIK